MGFELFRVELDQVVLVALNDEKTALMISSWRPATRPDHDRPHLTRVPRGTRDVRQWTGPRSADQTGSSRTRRAAMPEPHLRAADADRAAVAAVLGQHMSAGRLTMDEYDERLARAYAAKTYGELDQITADLPRPRSGPAPGRPVPRPPRHRVARARRLGRRPALLAVLAHARR